MKTLLNKKRKKKGFTLIEIIIVLAIIGILVTLIMPKFGNITSDAKVKADFANAKIIHDATAALLAQDKFTSEEIKKMETSTKVEEITSLKDYLQTIPNSKSAKGKDFNIMVKKVGTNNEKISVMINGTEVYPTLNENYK
ncbi:prepilin-type N-terminal cleavage/methylation domain-containing protein [Clostridium amazonitimonense]|uniref:prepilin-type N-terminal cleavage/methylation domain-containing protein n=1 Tax=Clostridium amazonitimonense TaxID=1499689 RepID=UPI0005095C63|nr:prepilin-type N-terminal cleavage/methylation domain-containing protein [Clostridium amazonitimonense]